MALVHRRVVGQLRGRVGVDGLQHAVPLAVRVLLDDQQVLRRQAGQRDSELGQLGHGARGVHVPPAGEHRELGEQPLRVGRQQLEAPVDRAAQGLLPLRQVARAAAELVQVLGQVREQVGRAPPVGVRGGQLDGQRQAVQQVAEAGDDGQVPRGQSQLRADRLGALFEQVQRRVVGTRPEHAGRGGRQPVQVRQGQRGYLVHLLAVHRQALPAGREHNDAGRCAEQLGDDRAGIQYLLEVVQHEQQRHVRQVLQQGVEQRLTGYLGNRQRMRDRRDHQIGVGRVGERHEHRAVLEVRPGGGRHGQ